MRLQRTIRKELVFEGKGLHTGREILMRLKPAPRDSGIVFHRVDKDVFIKAEINSVTSTAFATTLGLNGTRISTVEHILAAASGMDIDNMLIEVNGPEIPILDGSSAGFVEGILEEGTTWQASGRPYIKIIKPLVFTERHAEIMVTPYDGRLITYQIDFDHPLMGLQKLSMEIGEESFAKELAPARTFGFLKDVQYLRSRGLAMGGSLENAVIVSDKGVLNASGLRFEDEFIRHKMLDFIGDISLGGFPINGHFIVNRSGHSSNAKFLRQLLSSTACWRIVTEVEQPLKASA